MRYRVSGFREQGTGNREQGNQKREQDKNYVYLIRIKTAISLDGKSLKNTVTNYDQAQQNFINCVSALS
ncbi:MAG: hypothetical protein F6K56_36905 [Moorea sp. SIO3G5]|nr:hypothetical protein [Moorena sp. SIO3G5]